jgi:hypothetical protein
VSNFLYNCMKKTPKAKRAATPTHLSKDARLQKRAEIADREWKDALAKVELVAWRIPNVPLAKFAKTTAPKEVVRKILADNFPYTEFEATFKKHPYLADANVIIQEQMLKAIQKKYPALKKACQNYFD